MDAKSAAAATLLWTVEARAYVVRHLHQLHLDELVGGKRLWRVQAAKRTWSQVRRDHAQAVAQLRFKPLAQWSTADLPLQLRHLGRFYTWPLPQLPQDDPPPVRAARLEN